MKTFLSKPLKFRSPTIQKYNTIWPVARLEDLKIFKAVSIVPTVYLSRLLQK